VKTVRKIFFRSFLLQSIWNYELMQGAGYLYCIFPKLKELYQSPFDLSTACLRHLNYFNTHPYTVSAVLGRNARIEEENRLSHDTAAAASNRFKLQMGGPLAALGDKIFWSTWRPFTGLLGVLAVFLRLRPGFLVPLGFILIYNIPVIRFRYRTLIKAYTGELDLIDVVKRINTRFINSILPAAGLVTTAVCLGAVFYRWGPVRGGLLLGFTAAVALVRGRYRVSATLLLYAVSLAVFTGSLIVKW